MDMKQAMLERHMVRKYTDKAIPEDVVTKLNDRVRENNKLVRRGQFKDIVNQSIWQTLGRSINTSVTTLITLGALYILGVTSIKQFMLPLLIGVVCGTYSSIFMAGNFWVLFKGKKAR